MKLHDLLVVLDRLAPLRFAESWDNVGLLVGDPAADVTRVLVTVDYSAAVADEARTLGAELVVAYHPPMFAAVKRVPHGALWADAVRRGIALYSMHTALDVATDGTNDFRADACGVLAGSRRPLRPAPGRTTDDEAPVGIGRVGDVALVSLGEIVARLKLALGLDFVLVAGALDTAITRVAVAAGAGGELLGDAISAGANLFVTGELRHHDALSMLARGGNVIATLHSNSERAAVRRFGERLQDVLANEGVSVASSTSDADPFVVV